MDIGENISDSFRSYDTDGSGEGGENVVDVLDRLARRAARIADAITPNIVGNKDASGGHVESLTEAVMGVTAGLCAIAEAIDGLAAAVRKRGINSISD